MLKTSIMPSGIIGKQFNRFIINNLWNDIAGCSLDAGIVCFRTLPEAPDWHILA
jgi:hypothetical protein